MRSLNLLHEDILLGAWLLIAPIIRIVTIPQAFQPRCAPVVSQQLRYLMLSRVFQQFDKARRFLFKIDLGRSSSGILLTTGKVAQMLRQPRLYPFIS